MGLRPIQAKQTMKSKEGKNVKHINANLQLSKIYWDNIWINYHLQNLGKGKWTHKICLKTLQKGVGGGAVNKLVEIKAELSLQKWKWTRRKFSPLTGSRPARLNWNVKEYDIVNKIWGSGKNGWKVENLS